MLCASLSTQFEAMQYDWLNLGLQDPTITSTSDPVGANHPPTSSFTFSTAAGQACTVRELPRFAETVGGAYCFVPSMAALGWRPAPDGPPLRAAWTAWSSAWSSASSWWWW